MPLHRLKYKLNILRRRLWLQGGAHKGPKKQQKLHFTLRRKGCCTVDSCTDCPHLTLSASFLHFCPPFWATRRIPTEPYKLHKQTHQKLLPQWGYPSHGVCRPKKHLQVRQSDTWRLQETFSSGSFDPEGAELCLILKASVSIKKITSFYPDLSECGWKMPMSVLYHTHRHVQSLTILTIRRHQKIKRKLQRFITAPFRPNEKTSKWYVI